MTIMKLLSKKARENLRETSVTTLLQPEFIDTNEFLTKTDKNKLNIIRESYREYAVENLTRTQITSSEEAGKFCIKYLSHYNQEIFLVILLDTKNQVIEVKEIFKGTLNSSVVHPREVFKEAIKYSAHSIIVAHNHPSGDTTASHADLMFTERLCNCGDLMGIRVLDHIISGSNTFNSLAQTTNLFI